MKIRDLIKQAIAESEKKADAKFAKKVVKKEKPSGK